MTDIASAASSLAEEWDLPVFPVLITPEENGKSKKQPLTTKGFYDASKSLTQIHDWWARWPGAAVGVPTGRASRIFIVDIDPAGEPWYIENAHRLACGRIHRTQRGWHLLYSMPDGQDVSNSVSKIATGVDVRGTGGYMVWWPATGGSVVGEIDDIKPAPAWLLSMITARPVEVPRPTELEAGKFGEGQRNDFLSREAFRHRTRGANGEELFKILSAINQARVSPPVDDVELWDIINKKVRNVGVDAAFAPRAEEKQPTKLRFKTALEIASEPIHATWLLEPYIEKRCSILMYGDAGTFKSFLALEWALKIARSGERVIYFSAEGRGMWKRLRAWCYLNNPGVSFEETLAAIPQFLAIEVPLNFSDAETLLAVQAEIDAIGHPPAFVIIDTLSRYSDGQAEDKNSEANSYLNQLDQAIRVKYGASILIVHHTGLAEKQRARGAYSLTANTDANFRIERPDPLKYDVTVTSGRMKDCEAPAPFSLEAKVMDLGIVDTSGNPVTSLAIAYPGTAPIVAIKRPTGKAQRDLLKALEREVEEGAIGVWTMQALRDAARNLGFAKSTAHSAVVGLIQLQLVVPSVGGYRLAK